MPRKRKAIPKSLRFEVFKRDKFTCQYCGRSAPDVILEVDHMKSVSKGGDNDILNLVTSCRDCNRGKSNKELDDKSAVMVQKKQLEELQERREQLELMLQWRQSLEHQMDAEIEAINNFIETYTEWGLGEGGKIHMRKLLKQYGFKEVYTAWEIAIDRYYNGTAWSWDNAFKKVGGICYNRKKDAESKQGD